MSDVLNFSGVPELCRRYHVAQLDLFGSAADGRFDPDRSDIDFLVTFGDFAGMSAFRAYFGLRAELASMFGRDVDLVTESAVRNPFFRAKMDRQRRRLFPVPAP